MVALSDFHFTKEVGRGAYGVVHEVKNRATNEVFAMKVINFAVSNDGIPQSVVREMAALMAVKKLSHPNIVKLHEAFINAKSDTLQSTLHLLYEKCDWDLHHFLENIPRNMGETQCRWFAYQMFLGLEFLHCNSIIHRDIKPQNLLVTKNQNIKIADFGLARTIGLHSSFTTTVVTLWYRSPELLLQCGYNTAVDVWSMGCIVAELFTRQALFPLNSETEILFSIFEKLGLPYPDEWPSDSVVAYSTFPKHPKNSIAVVAPYLSNFPNVVDLIDQTLTFVPDMRPTAALCLQHPWFQELHATFFDSQS